MSDMRRMMMMFTRPVDSGGGGDDPTPVLPYDAEVEYLQSSGTQYIDTEVIPDSTTGLHIGVTCSDSVDSYLVGLRNNTSNTRWGIGHSNGGFYWCYGSYQTSNRLGGNIAELWLNYEDDKKFIATYNGTTKEATLPTLSFTPSYNIRLFGSAGVVASYSKWNGKIHFVQITQGSTIIMDLIPVRKNGVGYMYDKVSGELLGNSGSGSFTYGNDITT